MVKGIKWKRTQNEHIYYSWKAQSNLTPIKNVTNNVIQHPTSWQTKNSLLYFDESTDKSIAIATKKKQTKEVEKKKN